jgi:NADH-quinone oxidoreductase subunit G
MSMINIEIDGRQIAVESGKTVIDAAHQAGLTIPHFCYHKKLSIAANCRMCLVEVEKAPKPLPACATPAVEGMKVHTHSQLAVKAQQGVMEFLLINHPLDCPICDQGGECMLQDVSMGYGGVKSRFSEDKKVVAGKSLGALISAEEMSRCINCTRCVRFGQEIAGVMELGQANRTEHAEIMSFVGSTVDSELSGNMIDLCPVGALTSKPFRYTARSWELSRRKSVSPHDSLGSNLALNTKNNRVMRALPLENEDVNECWLSDRDRFSYEGLNSSDRLSKPMLKQGGEWIEVEWKTALEYVANALRQIKSSASANDVAALASGMSTLEELYLLQKLMRGIGSDNVDFRLRQSDFSADGKRNGAPWLGMSVAELQTVDRLLLVGSFLRKDHPLLAHRVREAAKQGAAVSVIHSVDDDLLMPLAQRSIVSPCDMVNELAAVLAALAEAKQESVSAEVLAVVSAAKVSETSRAMAANLASGKRAAVLLGNFAAQHPQAATLQHLAQEIAALTGARFGVLGEAANSVGGYLANAIPSANGLNAHDMLAQPRKGYLLLNMEPEFDCADPQLALETLHAADLVVMMTPYKTGLDYADVLLPVAPFTETSGTFVSTEGRVQSFKGAVKPFGESRPAWKVLRVLGNLMDVAGFDYENSESVRDEVLAAGEVSTRLNNALNGPVSASKRDTQGLQRVAQVLLYNSDIIVRRAHALQHTTDATQPAIEMNSADIAALGLAAGSKVRVAQGAGKVELELKADDRLPQGVARVPAGHAATAALGAMFGAITVERA